MLHAVKKVEYLKDFKLKLTFRNKDVKVVDLEKELLGPMFEPLKNIEYFKQVKTDGYTIVWPNQADFCPDVLHAIGKNFHETKKSLIQRKQKTAQNDLIKDQKVCSKIRNRSKKTKIS